MNVVAVGECTRDQYDHGDSTRVGGMSLNVAVHARRCGAPSALVSCTGSDVAGRCVREKLAREDVDASRVRRLPGATATQRILLQGDGERVFPPGGYAPGVLTNYALDSDDLRVIERADIVFVPWFREVRHLAEPALDASRRARRVVDALDGGDLGPGLSGIGQLPAGIDVLVLSALPSVANALLTRSQGSSTLFLVTHGAEGSTALHRGTRTFQHAVAVEASRRVDSTGCGDAFQAAFALAWFGGASLTSAMQRGAEQAAGVLQHLGASGE